MARLTTAVAGLAPPRLVRLLARAKSTVRRYLARRRYRPVLASVVPATASCELLAAFDDSGVFMIREGGRPTWVLKVSSSSTADEQLVAQAHALDALASLDGLHDWRRIVGSVLARGDHDRGRWFTQVALPGEPSFRATFDDDRLVTTAAEAIGPLHRATAEFVVVDEAVAARIVSQRADEIAGWCPELADELRAIDAALVARLARSRLSVSRLHGDYAPSNVLLDPIEGSVTGIVDWKFAAELLPPEIDLVQYAIALAVRRGRGEYGDVVIRVVEDPDGPGAGAVTTAVGAGPNDLDPALGASLAWLHHVSFSLHKAEDLRANPIWLQNNVSKVARRMASGQAAG